MNKMIVNSDVLNNYYKKLDLRQYELLHDSHKKEVGGDILILKFCCNFLNK